jgi:GntR family transcriptional regulator, transcriptional repressor for pyruvate dehydrogenase complex
LVNDFSTLIEPIGNRRTFEEISDKLKDLVFDGTLQPGQALPSEHALAKLFGVGRQSVREALRVLEISGFITVKPGKKGGSVVEGTLLSKMSDMFLDTFKLNRVSLKDCMAARKAIEVTILDFVLENVDDSDIKNLRENVCAARVLLSQNESTYQANIEFHRLLAKASKNQTFCIVIESILAVYAEFRSKMSVKSKAINKEILKIIENHDLLVEAIAEKDHKLAIELLRKDLSYSEGLILKGSGEKSGGE